MTLREAIDWVKDYCRGGGRNPEWDIEALVMVIKAAERCEELEQKHSDVRNHEIPRLMEVIGALTKERDELMEWVKSRIHDLDKMPCESYGVYESVLKKTLEEVLGKLKERA